MPRAVVVPIRRIDPSSTQTDHDLVAVEAPLGIEIRSDATGDVRSAGVLMRTPGDDEDLVRGWLLTERVATAAEVVAIEYLRIGDPAGDIARVTIAATARLEDIVERWALTPTSACGLCGRLSVERLLPTGLVHANSRPTWAAALVAGLPATLRAAQAVFAETGGLHAAGLFGSAGDLLIIREDIGRHNAVDKVIGASLRQAEAVPGSLLVVSGRAAFEIVQKAAVAGLMAVVAVGAPSSLAVEAARSTGLTLVGFARDGRFNVYSGADRIV